VARGHYDKHRLFREAPKLQAFSAFVRAEENGIQFALLNSRNKTSGIGLFKREIDVRVCASERAYGRSDDRVERRGAGKGHAERADFTPRGSLCRPDSPFRLRGNDLYASKKSPASLGEFGSLWNAMKKRGADFGLEILDLLTKRWLPDSDARGGAREILLLGNCKEIADMT
jgi:hypothetical protein